MERKSWIGDVNGVEWKYLSGLAYTIICMYLEEHPETTYDDFKRVFSREFINYGYDNGIENNSFLISVGDYEASTWIHKAEKYSTKKSVIIAGTEYYINGEWTTGTNTSNDIERLEELAINVFGYVIHRYNANDAEKHNYAMSIIGEEEYKYIAGLSEENELDSAIKVNARKEQSFLREYLFGRKKEDVCGICKKRMPIEMLVTSHIKKRAFCSKTEKLDYKNIVMPMCKCGCDDVYEKGFIYIDGDGIIKINYNKYITSDLLQVLKKIENKKCEYHNDMTEKYFRYHREYYGIN